MRFSPWRYAAVFGLVYLAAYRLFFHLVPEYHGEWNIAWVPFAIVAAAGLYPAFAYTRSGAQLTQLPWLVVRCTIACVPTWLLGAGWVLALAGAKQAPGVGTLPAIGRVLSVDSDAAIVIGIFLLIALVAHLVIIMIVLQIEVVLWQLLAASKPATAALARDPRDIESENP